MSKRNTEKRIKAVEMHIPVAYLCRAPFTEPYIKPGGWICKKLVFSGDYCLRQ